MIEADKPIVPAMTADAGPLEAMDNPTITKADLLPVNERPFQIVRTCPKCRVLQDCYYHSDIPPAYGRQTANAVFILCGNGHCQHQWRGILRGSEIR